MSDFYEPWTPEVGQRVRVRISAECQVRPDPGSGADRSGVIGHVEWEDGLTGVVMPHPVGEAMAAQGHRYMVKWDQERILDDERFNASPYAAIELEPIP